jgi:sugar O-acyltransferase (sialic acid O-acetyltransferase NeuD family)
MLYDGQVRSLYIFGAGEFASIAWSYFSKEGKYDMKGLVVDKEFLDEKTERPAYAPLYAYEDINSSLTNPDTDVFVAISASKMNLARANIYRKLAALGCTFASYVSPFAFISDKCTIGANVFIFENNVIQNGVTINDNTILWSGNHVGHHSFIGSHVFLSSHVVVSGYCKVDDYCYLGVNTTVIDHINIAQRCLIGAGSLVLKDTEPESVYFGSPAKRIEGKNPMDVIFR